MTERDEAQEGNQESIMYFLRLSCIIQYNQWQHDLVVDFIKSIILILCDHEEATKLMRLLYEALQAKKDYQIKKIKNKI